MNYQKIIEQISTKEDKERLAQLLEDVLLPFEQEINQRYDALEQKLLEETFLSEQEAVLYEGIFEYQKEMLPEGLYEELAQSNYVEEESGFYQEGDIVRELYLKCNGQQLQAIWENPPELLGAIVFEENEYPVKFTLLKDNRYEEAIHKVWDVLRSSGCNMLTPNLPYSNRMAVVRIHGLPSDLAIKKSESELIILYDRYTNIIDESLRPCWNVNYQKTKTFGFPMPCEDEVFYEHEIRIPKQDLEDSFYLVMEDQDMLLSRRRKEKICVSVREEDSRTFQLLQIHNVEKFKKWFESYGIVGGKIRDSFCNRYEAYYGTMIETRAQLEKLIKSIDESGQFFIETVEIGGDDKGETYNMNQFREVKKKNSIKEKMHLTFCYQGKRDYMMIDRLSYIVSSIGQYYRDYDCVGKIR